MALFIMHCVQCATFIVKDGNKYYVLCCLLYNILLQVDFLLFAMFLFMIHCVSCAMCTIEHACVLA
jgi:hypothetical protein